MVLGTASAGESTPASLLAAVACPGSRSGRVALKPKHVEESAVRSPRVVLERPPPPFLLIGEEMLLRAS